MRGVHRHIPFLSPFFLSHTADDVYNSISITSEPPDTSRCPHSYTPFINPADYNVRGNHKHSLPVAWDHRVRLTSRCM